MDWNLEVCRGLSDKRGLPYLTGSGDNLDKPPWLSEPVCKPFGLSALEGFCRFTHHIE
jgi:hypothetical protein